MKIKAIYKRIVFLFAAAFLSLFCLFESVFSIKAFADENSVHIKNYDSTRIEDDLADVNAYEYVGKDYVDIVRVQEYCYSEKSFMTDYYGLYIYVFNPMDNITDKESSPFVESDENVVTMAVEYNEDGTPSKYENIALEYLDKTDTNRFYKFKVKDVGKLYEIEKAYSQAHNKRRYDLAGFQFKKKNGNIVVTEQKNVTIGKTYIYTGYSAGCALESDMTDKESTLACEVQTLETIKLEIKHTNRLMENYGLTNHGDDNICDNLHTAYFSVPERYFTEYGNLQKIAAEWYEYKTSPIFVTSDEGAFNALQGYLGKTLKNVDGDPIDDDLKWRVIWDYTSKSLPGIVDSTAYEYYWRYNSMKLHNVDWSESFVYGDGVQNLPRMSWLLPVDTDSNSREEYRVSSEDLLNYATSYNKNQLSGIPLVRGKYSFDLFSTYGNAENGYELNAIDEDRQAQFGVKNGKVSVEIDAGEKFDLVDMTDADTFWEKMLAYRKDEGHITQKCIEELTDSKVISELTANSFADKYSIGKQEAEAVQDFAIKEIEAGNRVILFRFATTDYYAANARFDKYTNNNVSSEDGFVSQQTVFLDFDIISLTFRDEMQNDTVIGVVANPVDIFSSIEPGSDMRVPNDWWDNWLIVVGLFLGCLGLLLFWPFLAPLLGNVFNLIGKGLSKVFDWIIALIALPFKLIGKLFDKMFHKKE